MQLSIALLSGTLLTGSANASLLALLSLAPAPDSSPESPPPADPRGYEGPGGVDVGAGASKPSGPAKGEQKPPAKPAEEEGIEGELTMDDVFGAAEADASESGSASAPAKTEAAASGPQSDVSMDDVFGDGGGTPGESAANSAADDKPPPPDVQAKKRPIRDHFDGKLDFKLRLLSSVYYAVDRVKERGIDRNENRVEAYVAYNPNRHVEIVGGIEAVFMGVSQAQNLDDLATRQLVTPFHFESDAAYVALHDIAPGLSLKVGRQIVVWGTADKFSPTNNINPDDLEDRPIYTEPIANQMAVLDYAPPKLKEKLFFQLIYVPLFYPALLPPSAAAGLLDPQSEIPFAFYEDRQKIGFLQDDFLPRNPKLYPVTYGTVVSPKAKFTNGQFAAKIGSNLGPVDFSASYYYGRHDIPFPVEVESSQLAALSEDPDPETGAWMRSDVKLVYPRMQVVGLDFSTQLPFLGNMGLWGEAALFIPQAYDLRVELPVSIDVTPDDGVANPVYEINAPAIRKNPYIKATAGLDYTFGKHVYVQAQYLRGFINEFGADHIGDYVVGGTDVVFFGRHLIFRVFGVVDFPTNNDPGEGTSGVIAPSIIGTLPWGYVTFELGSFAFLQRDVELSSGDTRFSRTFFGQPGVGSSIVYFKAIGQF
ncbi:MAG: hypothetical protein H6713_37605 [Myxococcales bacterium]|nr:hypothetical protein [Myxococcales bacterium]